MTEGWETRVPYKNIHKWLILWQNTFEWFLYFISNFLARLSWCTLGKSKQKYDWQHLTRSILLVLNSFIKICLRQNPMNLNQFSSSGKLLDRIAKYTWLTTWFNCDKSEYHDRCRRLAVTVMQDGWVNGRTSSVTASWLFFSGANSTHSVEELTMYRNARNGEPTPNMRSVR